MIQMIDDSYYDFKDLRSYDLYDLSLRLRREHFPLFLASTRSFLAGVLGRCWLRLTIKSRSTKISPKPCQNRNASPNQHKTDPRPIKSRPQTDPKPSQPNPCQWASSPHVTLFHKIYSIYTNFDLRDS